MSHKEDKDIAQDIKRIKEILSKLEPRFQKHLGKMIEKDGSNVTLSVATNISTSLMATCLLIVEQNEGDIHKFMEVMAMEIMGKYNEASSKVKAAKNFIKAVKISSGYDTCAPLH